MKRLFALMMILSVCCTIPAYAQPGTSASSAVLYDPLTETAVYAKNAEQRRGMASTTKIMTAVVALDQYDPDSQVVIRSEWCGIEGSSMYLRAGEKLKVCDLLYGLLLESGNDAATALAGLYSGVVSDFVSLMNDKAEALGLTQTHFDNPSGLDGKTHYTTALDLARLTAHAMRNPLFAKIVATKSVKIGERYLNNHNRLLGEIDACGVKTGYTMSCGRCLVSAKEEQGRLLICVTLNDRDDWRDHKALYEAYFPRFQLRELVGSGDCGQVALASSEKQLSRLYCNESFSAALSEDEFQRVKVSICGARICYGTIIAGAVYGEVRVTLDQRLLFHTPVYFASTSQETAPEKNWLQKLLQPISELFD